MAYEFLVYKEHSKALPRVGEKINTADGRGRVVEVNILKRLVSVDVGEGKIIKMVIPKVSEN
jgi:cell fate regulator YaaT (PSP1 superfamily)